MRRRAGLVRSPIYSRTWPPRRPSGKTRHPTKHDAASVLLWSWVVVRHDALVSYPLVSLGYQGRDARELVENLVAAQVSVLVDVRLTPSSRKPGLSKRRLGAALAEAAVGYIHLPELGNPKDNRDQFRAGNPDSVEKYRQIVRGAPGSSALAHVAELLDNGVVALLCFERDHATCHWRIVTGELQRADPYLQVLHL